MGYAQGTELLGRVGRGWRKGWRGQEHPRYDSAASSGELGGAMEERRGEESTSESEPDQALLKISPYSGLS